MGRDEILSRDEIKQIVCRRLNQNGIDPELIRITIMKGPKVVLNGEVYSLNTRRMIKQVVLSVDEIEDVIDKLMVVSSMYDDLDDGDNSCIDEGKYAADGDLMGTEDMYQAIEDGIPYIPPTSASFEESFVEESSEKELDDEEPLERPAQRRKKRK